MSGGLPNLTRLVSLMTPVRAADGAGGYTEIWTELGKLWAEVKPGSGRAVGEAGLPLARTSYRITVRAAEEGSPRRPLPGQRFEHGNRRFIIQSVTERDAHGRFLICAALEDEVVT